MTEAGRMPVRTSAPLTRGSCGCDTSASREDQLVGNVIRPSDFLPLFGNELGSIFLLVTAPQIRETLQIESDGPSELREYTWIGPESRKGLINLLYDIQREQCSASVLWIADSEFEHYDPKDLGAAKLGAISYCSGGFTPESLARCLRIVKQTDYEHELQIEAEFLKHLEQARRIVFSSPHYGTMARFEHQQAEHWFSLHGPLAISQQTVLPTGELSTLTNASGEYSFGSRFSLDGEIVLRGEPVVHRGSSSVTSSETAAMYAALSTMRDYTVIAHVKGGLIEGVSSPDAGPNPFLDAIQELFDRDERYRKIHEIGFGTNKLCSPLVPGNFFPNERYPAVHFGLGLGGYTSFHNDLVCTEVDVVFELANGEMIDIYRTLGLR